MLAWTEIETVLLDMDGTLLDLHFDNYFWLHHVPMTYSQIFSVEHSAAIDDLYGRFEREKGKMSWYCLDYWSTELGLDIVALKRDVKEKIAIRPHVQEFLRALKEKGKRVILVTNAHRGSLDLKMQETGLAHHFDALVSSHDYGIPKENVALWRQLQNQHDFEPSQTLLVDDTEPVLSSAKAYGIAHLLTLKQPDSQQPARDNLCFPSILHFDEVMPYG